MRQTIRARAIDGILDDVFRQYRNYFLPLLLVSLVFMGPYAVINAMITSQLPSPDYNALLHGQSGVTQFFSQMQNPASTSTLMPVLLAQMLVSLLAIFLVTPLTQGSYYLIGTETLQNEKLTSVWPFVGRAVRRWGAYLATMLLLIGLGLVAVVVLGLVVGGIALAFSGAIRGAFSGSGAGPLITIVLLLYVALICLAIWLSIRLAFVYIVVVVERKRNWGALKRSFFLTKGSFWRIFGIWFLAGLVLMFASFGLTAIINIFLNGTVRLLATGLISILLAPLFHLLLANLYIDMRVRREGYDIELMATQGRDPV